MGHVRHGLRTRHSHGLIAVVVVAALAGPAHGNPIPWYEDGPQPHGPGGTVLVDRPPSNVGGLASDTLVNEFPGWQRVADDFSLSHAAIIDRIVFFGFHHMNIQPVANEDFRIRVYDQRPGDLLPGSVLYEQSFSNVPRTWTGRFVLVSGAPQEFRYEVDLSLPLELPATTTLWLEVAQIGDINSLFRWENSLSAPLNGKAYINPITPNMDWRYSLPELTTNTAFQLIGNIPEPCSFVFLAIAGIALFRQRSHRQV